MEIEVSLLFNMQLFVSRAIEQKRDISSSMWKQVRTRFPSVHSTDIDEIVSFTHQSK